MTQELEIVQQPQPALMRPVVPVQDLIKNHDAIMSVVNQALRDGVDYGIIPGASKNKILFKPGAERLCAAFGLVVDYDIISCVQDPDRKNSYYNFKERKNAESSGFYSFTIKCILSDRSGRRVGSAIGSCSTMESKYISRPRDCENTALKMAEKRALVAATLNVLGLSSSFTQDIEDFASEETRKPQREVKQVNTAKAVVYTPEQLKLFATAKAKGLAADSVKKFMQTKFSVGDSSCLTPEQCDELCKAIDAGEVGV